MAGNRRVRQLVDTTIGEARKGLALKVCAWTLEPFMPGAGEACFGGDDRAFRWVCH